MKNIKFFKNITFEFVPIFGLCLVIGYNGDIDSSIDLIISVPFIIITLRLVTW